MGVCFSAIVKFNERRNAVIIEDDELIKLFKNKNVK